MMISVGIFVIISSVVLANYNGFNTRILLTNLAYDIALTIRQAQVYGISVRESAGVGTARPYGVYFEETDTTAGSATSFIFFTDSNGDNIYNGTAGTCSGECIQKYDIKKGNRISSICALSSTGTNVCTTGGGSLRSATLLFKRPNPDAVITAKLENGTDVSAPTRATVQVASPQGVTKTITIELTGQISVN